MIVTHKKENNVGDLIGDLFTTNHAEQKKTLLIAAGLLCFWQMLVSDIVFVR